MTWTYGRKLSPLLLSLALCFLPVSSSAETVYTVTESQMEIWTQGLYKLKTNNETLQSQLTTQQERLNLLQTQLTESKTAIEKAKSSQSEAETSLTNFKESLTKYEEQNEKTERRLKRQRTIWAIVAGVAAGYGISKS